jgi:hypothetical protein
MPLRTDSCLDGFRAGAAAMASNAAEKQINATVNVV